jgi:short-subunit dehydrogenase
MNYKEKYGEYALITGGSSGIGKAIANELASEGLNLILVARREEELQQAAKEIKAKHPVDVVCISADLLTDEGMQKVKQETEKHRVGLLVGTKAYVLNFGASLYAELQPKGIDVTVLSPGLTNTPMTADNGIDWSKTPMQALPPEVVAQTAVNALGKKLIAIPGFKNKMMGAMAKHTPFQMASIMGKKMMDKAINPNKI